MSAPDRKIAFKPFKEPDENASTEDLTLSSIDALLQEAHIYFVDYVSGRVAVDKLKNSLRELSKSIKTLK
jgi:hypothetical protein